MQRYHRPTVFAKVFAATMLVLCIVLLLRLALSDRLRWRFDAAVRRAWTALSAGVRSLRDRVRGTREEHKAKKAAEAAIRRARSGSWDGNVFRPASFDDKRRNGADSDEPPRRKDLH